MTLLSLLTECLGKLLLGKALLYDTDIWKLNFYRSLLKDSAWIKSVLCLWEKMQRRAAYVKRSRKGERGSWLDFRLVILTVKSLYYVGECVPNF